MIPSDEQIPALYLEDGDNLIPLEQEIIPFPFALPYTLSRSRLPGLGPDKVCTLISNGKPYRFKTFPKEEELRFIIAGDLYEGKQELYIKISRSAAEKNPHFAVLGGDLAYASNPGNRARWIEWLRLWSETMITSEGYMIPMTAAIGNNDTSGRLYQSPSNAPIFYMLFRSAYQVLDINQAVSIFILDSGHTHSIDGEQEKWLSRSLKARRNKIKFAAYHVPAWTALKKNDSKTTTKIQNCWIPHFDSCHLTAAFEHHEHNYKRTFPLRNLQIDPQGTLYLGNGGFGAKNTRRPFKPSERWYLEKTAAKSHFIFVSVQKNRLEIQAIDSNGMTFDQIDLLTEN